MRRNYERIVSPEWGERKNNNANMLSSPSELYYVNGTFGGVKLSLLLNSGAGSTIIDEEMWKVVRGNEELESVSFSIKSATQHALEVLGQKTVSFNLFNERNGSRNVTAKVVVVRGSPYKGIIGVDFLMKYSAKINIEKKLTLYEGRRRSVHNLVQKRAEYSGRQVIVTDYVEMEPGSQKEIKCKVRGEVKSNGENCISFGRTIGAIEVVQEKRITACLVNTTGEKLTLTPDSVIGRLKCVPRKRETMTVILSVIYKDGKFTKEKATSRPKQTFSNDTVMNTLDVVKFESAITEEEITKAQNNDTTVKEILENLETWKKQLPTSSHLKPFVEKADELYIYNGILYQQLSDEKVQIILPLSLYKKVLEMLHASPLSGHLGEDKTTSRFLETFYWPNIRKSIAKYIKQCEKCEIFKVPKENTIAPLKPIETNRVLELLVMDYIGPLPIAKNGNRYILTMIDHFSKFGVAFPTNRQDSQTVISCLQKFCSSYGPVERILTDNEKSFISKETLDFLKVWNIKKATSTACHAQTQGICERWNGTLIQILKRYVTEDEKTWDEKIEMAAYAYNTAVQRTNEYTPYEVMFGRKLNTPFKLLQAKKNLPEDVYLANQVRERQLMEEVIAKNQALARTREKETYDKKSGKTFEVGEQIMLFNPAVKLGGSKKFSPHYKGPYVINKKLGETNYVLKPLKEGLREETVHQNRLKRSFLKVETEQVPVEIKVENKKTLRKREELLKYLQPAQMNTATATTTDSDYELWEEQMGIACSKPRNIIKTKKNRKLRHQWKLLPLLRTRQRSL